MNAPGIFVTRSAYLPRVLVYHRVWVGDFADGLYGAALGTPYANLDILPVTKWST